MTPSNRNPLRSWMFIYVGLIAAYALAGGQPADTERQEALVPTPEIVGSAPLFRKDI